MAEKLYELKKKGKGSLEFKLLIDSYSFSNPATTAFITQTDSKSYDISGYDYVLVSRAYVGSENSSAAHSEFYIGTNSQGWIKHTKVNGISSNTEYGILLNVKGATTLNTFVEIYHKGSVVFNKVYAIK